MTPHGVIGVLSTYFPQPVRLSRDGMRKLDRIAREVATVLETTRYRS